MLKFEVGESCFNYRSAAVIILKNHILVTKSEADDFWALPGGRVEFFESSEDTISRELLEELDLKCSVKRLLWHVENFFEYSSKQFHEISNYFLAELTEPPQINSEIDFRGIEKELNLIFRWLPIPKLSEYVLKPDFLVDGVQNLPKSVEYIKCNELENLNPL
jgi:8-oxo-dGTP pyrophosphatase MutT (NUDIX family)